MTTAPYVDNCEYRYTTASGFSNTDCWALGLRTPFEQPFSPEACESWAFRLNPSPVPGKARMTPDWGHLAWVTDLHTGADGWVHTADARGVMWSRAPGPLVGPQGWQEAPVDFTPTGVWGIDGAALYAWGLDADGPTLRRFDGSTWARLPPPGAPIASLHGLRPDLLVAGGEGGYVAMFDGSAWHAARPATSNNITGVFAAAEDVWYAVTEHGRVLEGAPSGWMVRASAGFPLYAVAERFGRVWLAAKDDGLHELTPKGDTVTPVNLDLPAVDFDARAGLLIACTDRVAWTSDGAAFDERAVNGFERAVAARPPLWDQ